jgi:hypothetical protein
LSKHGFRYGNIGPQTGAGAQIAGPQVASAASQVGRLAETIGPQTGAGAAAQDGAHSTTAHGRHAKSERSPLKSSHEAPVQEAQQDAHETSGPAAAAHGAQSCAETVETAHAEIKAKQNAIKRFFIGKLLF